MDRARMPHRARIHQGDPLAFLYRSDEAEGRRLKAALLAAALAHGGLLLVVFPGKPIATEVPPKERAHYILERYRIRQPTPPPPPKPISDPVPARKRIPMPTPPDAPPPDFAPEAPLPIAVPVSLAAQPMDLPDVIIPAPPRPPAPSAPIPVSGAEAPHRIFFVEPRYSEMARRLRIDGTVILDAIIGRTGMVESVVALRELPFGLTEAAIEAVEQWRYEPPRVDGRPVSVRMTVSVHFSLR